MATRRRATTATTADVLLPRITHLESEMGEVKKTLSGIITTLQDMSRMQAEMRASAPGSWQDMLQSVNNMAWLFALVVGGIIWISSMVNTTPTSKLEGKISVLEQKLSAIYEERNARYASSGPASMNSMSPSR